MKEDAIIVIEKVEPKQDDKGEFRLVTDKAGNEYNIKRGQYNALQKKWPLLDENIGKAVRLKYANFKGNDFVTDFEVVSDVFEQQAAERIQSQVPINREASIEAQVAYKGIIELIIADILPTDGTEFNVAMKWARDRLGDTDVVVESITTAVKEATKEPQLEAPKKERPIKKIDANLKAIGWTRQDALNWLANEFLEPLLDGTLFEEHIASLSAEKYNAFIKMLNETLHRKGE